MVCKNARREWDGQRRTFNCFLATLACLAGVLLAGCEERARGGVETAVWGLNNPRGIAFDARGRLYVAEAGWSDRPGRIVRVGPDGSVESVAEGLPFAPNPQSNSEDVGLSGLAFDGPVLYAVTGQGYNDRSSFLFRINGTGALEPHVRLWARTRVDLPNQDSGTNPFDVAISPVDGRIYVSDAAGNKILRILEDRTGYEDFAVFAGSGSGPVPTGLAVDSQGAVYVAVFSGFPHTPGTGYVARIGANGVVAEALSGLTTPIDVAFDTKGVMYVLEFSAGYSSDEVAGFVPDSGRLLKLGRNGPEVVAEGLNYPISIAFSPTGDLYVSVGGAFQAQGGGGVVKIRLRNP